MDMVSKPMSSGAGNGRSATGRAAKAPHPTRELLLKTALTLLEHRLPHDVTSDMVLNHSEISRGSLYHHFEDFSDLIEAALVCQFAEDVDGSIAMIAPAMAASKSAEDLLGHLSSVVDVTHGPDRRGHRFSRARLIAMSETNPRLAARLAAEQDRLTAAIADMIGTAQERGWMSREYDARSAAVLVQAYSLGKLVDDVSTQMIDSEAWNSLIKRLIRNVLF
jgi:AcrR family transcriptional regulator